MKKKSEEFNYLKKRILGIAFNLADGTIFIFNDLNLRANFPCSTAIQQDVGRWFSHFVKKTPNVPFIIIGKKGSNLLYCKTNSNTLNYNKGGNN